MTRMKNEADVREEIAMPLLSLLGYKIDTENDIWREFYLTYDKIFLGRKKPNDPPLRGNADYVLSVLGIGRWVLETKTQSEKITQDDVEQVISYSKHPEVSGIYAAVLNGERFVLYHSFQSSTEKPIVDLLVTSPEDLAAQLKGVLSPASIKRDCKPPIIDLAKPLADGIRSSAKILGGHMIYERCDWNCNIPIPPEKADEAKDSCRRLIGQQGNVTRGTVWRDQEGIIIAKISFSSSNVYIAEMLKEKKLEEATYVALADEISNDPNKTNIFEIVNSFSFTKGEKYFDTVQWKTKYMNADANINNKGQISGFLKDDTFSGHFRQSIVMTFPLVPNMRITLETSGPFEVLLDTR